MDKLYFLTAGVPLRAGTKGYKRGFEIHDEMGLDGLELEFVHGVRISDKSREEVKASNKIITAHAPFYINLNAREDEKVEASVQRIIETAMTTNELGGYSITYHAGFYLGQDPETVYEKIKKQTEIITSELNKIGNKIWVRPETTGKSTQWGDLDEIIRLSKEFETVLPCVDFSHIHARYNGFWNTYDEFASIFEKIGNVNDVLSYDYQKHSIFNQRCKDLAGLEVKMSTIEQKLSLIEDKIDSLLEMTQKKNEESNNNLEDKKEEKEVKDNKKGE